ncbi:MAG: glycosyltransferase family 39 protein [Candidatus Margulisiibacteriota bacterium]
MKFKNQKSKIKIDVVIILILLSSILFFFKLGSFSLYDAAETTYGEFIKQMRLTGDWITLRYNAEIIFDKPPLYYWLATIATYIFGFNEFAIRFWAAACGVLTVLTTFFLGKSFYNQRTGFFSAIIAMTSFQFLIQSRIAELDILLTLLITSAFLFFWYGYQTGKKYFYWVFYLMMALAVITKGIIGIALPGFAIFLFLLFKKELGRIKEMQLIPGFLIILLIGAPWYIAEWLLHGQKFTEFVLGFLFLARFGGVVAGHPGPWYYYFLAVILGFAPWSHFLPYSLFRTWKLRTHNSELITLCYIIPVFIVFSIAKTKLPSYLLPLYPFFAIMAGKLWDDFLGSEQQTMKKGMTIANVLLAVVVILIIIGFTILGTSNYSGQYQELMPNLLLLAGILVAGSLISIGSFFFKKYKVSFMTIPAMVFIITLILTTQTLPAVEKYKGSRELGQKVAQVIKKHEKIAAYNVGNRPSVVFYSSKPITFLENEKQVLDFIRKKKGYCFTTISEHEKLKGKVKIFAEQGELLVIY